MIFFTASAYSGEFNLDEQDPANVVTIPGTDMKGGMFRYLISDAEQTFKAGVLVNEKTLYYAAWPDPGGDCNFGVYRDYFLTDCYSYGASHNRIMYLFRVGGEKVELLDVLIEAHIPHAPGMDFMSAYTGHGDKEYGFLGTNLTEPTWTEVKDYDGDGNPEIKLIILTSDDWDDERVFRLYLELKDDSLQVDLNPALYRPLYEEEKRKYGGETKSDGYYVYGYLAGELRLDDIKARLLHTLKTRFPKDSQYHMVVPLLEAEDQWDGAFHFDDSSMPELKVYERR